MRSNVCWGRDSGVGVRGEVSAIHAEGPSLILVEIRKVWDVERGSGRHWMQVSKTQHGLHAYLEEELTVCGRAMAI